MEAKRIDFFGVIVVDGCNPNGDPMQANRPRTDFNGRGVITPECLKRKIRNRMQALGYEIFVQSNDRISDGYGSLSSRYSAFAESSNISRRTPEEELAAIRLISRKWLDVRAFGQVFAYKGGKKENASLGIRGPVSLAPATSLEIPEIQEYAIARSAHSLEFDRQDSGTIGRKWRTWGAYAFSGGIYPQMAEKTGFTFEDGEILKQCILTMFDGDASASRPSGTMDLGALVWFTHKSKYGSASPIRLFRSIQIESRKEWPYYEADFKNLGFDNVQVEVHDMIGGGEDD